MSGSVVQSAHANSSAVTTRTITPTSNLGAGDLLVASFFGRGTAHGISGNANIWSKQLSITNLNGNIHELWTCPVTGGDVGAKPTTTFTQTGADWMTIIYAELTGVDNSATPISVSAVAASLVISGQPSIAGPTGTSGANEFAIVVGQVDGAATMSAHTGFTLVENVGTSLPANMSSIVVNNSALTGTTDMSAGDTWTEIVAVFKLAAGTQTSAPNAWVSNDAGWTDDLGSSTAADLLNAVNGTGGRYLRSPVTPVNSKIRFQLSSVTAPHSGVRNLLTNAYKSAVGGVVNFTFNFINRGNSSVFHTFSGGTLSNVDQIASIMSVTESPSDDPTDWAAIDIEIVANQSG